MGSRGGGDLGLVGSRGSRVKVYKSKIRLINKQ